MNSLIKHIQKRRAMQLEKGWKKLYWAIDLHGTIVPYYEGSIFNATPYPYAIKTLNLISRKEDQCFIIWTSTDPCTVWNHVYHWLYNMHGVTVEFHNANPESNSEGKADFSSKFYFDILLDDKAGFDVKSWKNIYKEVKVW